MIDAWALVCVDQEVIMIVIEWVIMHHVCVEMDHVEIVI